jgi:arsenite-transporting ATPase
MKKGFIFIGKGGVGKTTCSAALALKLSDKGKTLIASLDPAHNLGDVYGVELSGKPKIIKENLYAMEVDTDLLTKKYLERTVSKIKDMYSYLKVLNLDRYVDSLKYSPGIEEYSILEGLINLISEEYDYIILDMPPTGLTIKVLTLPYTALIWIEKLMELRKDILGRRRAIESITGRKCVVIEGKEVSIPVDEEEDPVMKELEDKKEKMELVKEFLSQKCSIVLVTNPEPLSLFEGRRAIEALKSFGLDMSRIILNKFSGENEVTREIESMGEAIRIPFLEEPPRGVEQLKKISEVVGSVLN